MASQEHGFGPWSSAGVPADPEPQMQADIDQHAADHAAAVSGAGAAGSGGAVPPGLPQEPSIMSLLQTMQQMMQMMMTFQSGQGTTTSGTSPQRH